MSKYTLEQLAVDHPYYCHLNNYYSNDPYTGWFTMTNFLDEYEDADEDLNLCFRWDVRHDKDTGLYSASVFLMHQRKGIFAPHEINSITEDEVDRFVAYLNKHLALINKLWQPLTGVTNEPQPVAQT